MGFLHDMAFAIPVCGSITLTWAVTCRYLWRQGKPVEEP